MALANFFDKAAASAADVLRDFDREAFRDRLQAQVIGVAFDGSAARSREGQATLDLAVRCLARLYPRLVLVPLGDTPARFGRALRELALGINPALEMDLDPGLVTLCLTVGRMRAGAPVEVFTGSDRWIAKVSCREPVGCGRSSNPFGAGAAACLGAANIFRAVFGDQLKKGALDENGRLSLLNFATGDAAKNGSLDVGLDLTSSSLVGLGAIGNAAVWALARLPGARGAPFMVEPEPVDLSNLQRYVLALQRHVGQTKLNLAHEAFAGGDIKPRLIHATWAEFVQGLGHAPLDRVAAALDSAHDRVQVQAALPRRVFNAWTQTGDLGVSRHDFLEGPCLACLYLPTGATLHQDELIRQALGLDAEQRVRLREMLVRGDAVGPAFTEEVAGVLGLAPDALAPFAGLPLHAFYREAICGGVVLRLGGKPAGVEAPLVFQSALAGLMLAAELVADVAGTRRQPLPTKSVLDVTRPLPQRLGVALRRAERADGVRCLCEDRDFVDTYRVRYGRTPLDERLASEEILE
jgi:hypothetical protein